MTFISADPEMQESVNVPSNHIFHRLPLICERLLIIPGELNVQPVLTEKLTV